MKKGFEYFWRKSAEEMLIICASSFFGASLALFIERDLQDPEPLFKISILTLVLIFLLIAWGRLKNYKRYGIVNK